jgi:hypothetical protein
MHTQLLVTGRAACANGDKLLYVAPFHRLHASSVPRPLLDTLQQLTS